METRGSSARVQVDIALGDLQVVLMQFSSPSWTVLELRFKVGGFKSEEHHAHSGARALSSTRRDHRCVAAVQRAGADLLLVQCGNSQAGSWVVYTQPDVLQPASVRLQHAVDSYRGVE